MDQTSFRTKALSSPCLQHYTFSGNIQTQCILLENLTIYFSLILGPTPTPGSKVSVHYVGKLSITLMSQFARISLIGDLKNFILDQSKTGYQTSVLLYTQRFELMRTQTKRQNLYILSALTLTLIGDIFELVA